ncbi:TonB-dependent receptor domain-containing protein [Sphingomonas panacis]|uniref:TonB-dependent receptor domain-containing protein n=1 Tax=Sphingomonas panacis TaxID=1560345 RepID=UPI000A57225E|nr:TonB-dependent receptor [Sphingomonas panacis]
MTLLDAKFRDFPVAPFATRGGGVPLRDGDASGNRLPYAPKTTFSLNGTYRIPTGADQLVLSGTVLHSGSYYFEPDNIAKQRAYTSFNAVARFEIDNGRYYVEAFGKNLGNVAVTSVVLTNPTGASNTSLQPPRTYGVTLGFKCEGYAEAFRAQSYDQSRFA